MDPTQNEPKSSTNQPTNPTQPSLTQPNRAQPNLTQHIPSRPDPTLPEPNRTSPNRTEGLVYTQRVVVVYTQNVVEASNFLLPARPHTLTRKKPKRIKPGTEVVH